MNKLTLIATLIVAGFLTSCGGGGGSTTPNATISGQAADGYLQNAKVCADVNGDSVCNDSEPQQRETGADGSFTLPATAANYPIIVEVVPTTIDSDTGLEVSSTYTLSAPKGKTFISPITTMIQNKISESEGGLSADEAAIQVQNTLNMSGDAKDLYVNYMPFSGSEGTNTYKVIHQSAQAIARVMGESRKALKKQFNDLGVTENIDKLLHQRVQAKVDEMAKSLYEDAKTYIYANPAKPPKDRAQYADTFVKGGSNTATIGAITDGFDTKTAVINQRDIVNRGKTGDKSESPKTFLERNKNSVVGAAEVNQGVFKVYLETFKLDAPNANPKNDRHFSSYGQVSTATFTASYSGKDNPVAFNNLTTLNNSRTMVVRADGNFEIKQRSGSEFLISKVVTQPINDLTFNCRELVSIEDGGRLACKDPKFKDKKVKFTGDKNLRHLFTYQEYTRFQKDKVITQITDKDFGALCDSGSILASGANGRDEDYQCTEEGDYFYTQFMNPVVSTHVMYTPHDKAIYRWSKDTKSSQTASVVACYYENDTTKACVTPPVNIGKLQSAQLTSGETVFVMPKLDDYGDVVGELKVRTGIPNYYKYYRVNSNAVNGKSKIRTHKVFNWDAYKKIFNEFTK